MAKIWGAILDITVKPEDVPLMMIAYKIVREVNKPKRDNRVDMAGYAKVLDIFHNEEHSC